jgi:methionine-rich copper-binding protein CopC
MHRIYFAFALLAVLASPLPAHAHAQLDHAQPAPGARLAVAPAVVDLWFTEAVEPKFSSIVVQNAKGVALQNGTVTRAPGNSAQLSIKLKALAPGTYKVLWRVLSVDTHRSQGSFSFSVGP